MKILPTISCSPGWLALLRFLGLGSALSSSQIHSLYGYGIVLSVLLQADDLLRAIRNLIRFESTFLLQYAGCQPPKGCSFKMCWLYVLLQYLHQWNGVTSCKMKLCGRIETLNWKLYLNFGLFYSQLCKHLTHVYVRIYESRLGSCYFWWIIKRLGSRDQITDTFISN